MPESMNPVSIQIMLGQSIKDLSSFLRVRTCLSADHFDPVTERWQRLLWGVVCTYYTRNNQLPGLMALRLSINQSLHDSPTYMAQSEMDSLGEFVDAIFSDNEPLTSQDEVVRLAQEFVDTRFVKPQISVNPSESVSEAISRLSTLTAATRIDRLGSVNVFDVGDSNVTSEVFTQPEATNADFFDSVLGGGLRSRDIILLAAPSKGGKTTAALTIATSVARSQRHVVYVSLEQKAVPELRDLSWSCATGIPRSRIFGIHIDQMSPDVRNAIRSCQPLAPYLRMLDYSTNDRGLGGMLDIKQFVHSECEADRKPWVVIVDWMSLLARRVMTQKKSKSSNDESSMMRMILMEQVGLAKSIAIQYDTRIIMVQQLSGEAASRRGTSPAQITDTMDCKTMHLECTGAVVIGRKDEQGFIRVSTPVIRHGANAEVDAKLLGDCCRIELASMEERSSMEPQNPVSASRRIVMI